MRYCHFTDKETDSAVTELKPAFPRASDLALQEPGVGRAQLHPSGSEGVEASRPFASQDPV